ncbi:MAG TPA: hypothetical protein VNR42_03915, partial [Solirubrobacteraceae bacterium]|nr:hypothetical protein [Solirubrobacteraceae bacterium]
MGVLLAAGALAVSGVAASASTRGAHAAACAGRSPRAVRLRRLSGPRARLSWGAPAGSSPGAVYRVLRSGRTVGQTTATSIVLKVTPGRLTSFTVLARHPGASLACSAKLRTRVVFRPPGRVASLRILSHTASGVTIGWRRARRGDASVVGYRVQRDGAVVGQIRALSSTLRLSGARAHTVNVVAVDSRGHLGAASATLVIGARSQSAPPAHATPPAGKTASVHTPPSAPGLLFAVRVDDTSATLSWQEGSANGGATVTG